MDNVPVAKSIVDEGVDGYRGFMVDLETHER